MSFYKNVGISLMEVYFPPRCVDQKLFEEKEGKPGKYTKGLGQIRMAFTGFYFLQFIIHEVNFLKLILLFLYIHK